MAMTFDQDALVATVELVGRSGARSIEIGYVHENVPVEEAGWYASAQFRGARISVDDHRGPMEAVDALARRILTDAKCNHCKKPISIADDVPGCRWRRMGDHWKRGCE